MPGQAIDDDGYDWNEDTDGFDPEDDGELPPDADRGIVLDAAPSGRDTWGRPAADDGASDVDATAAAAAMPAFGPQRRDVQIQVELQRADGSWAQFGTMPGNASVDHIIAKVRRAGKYRLTGVDNTGRPIRSLTRIVDISPDHFTLTRVLAEAAAERAATGGAPLPGGFHGVGGGVNTMEDITKLLQQLTGPQQDALREEKQRLAEREARLEEIRLDAMRQQSLAGEVLSDRGFQVMKEQTETQQQMMQAGMTQIMQMHTLAMQQIQAQQAAAAEQARQEAARQREEDRQREADRRREHQDRMEAMRQEAQIRREEEERKRAADAREREEREERRRAQEREDRDRRDREWREERDAKAAREERERLREEQRQAAERAEARENRRYREEREDKLTELTQKTDPLNATIGTITAVGGLLTSLGMEPAELFKQLAGGAKANGIADIVREGLEVVKESVKAQAASGVIDADEDDDDEDDVATLLLEGPDGSQQVVNVPVAEVAAVRKRAASRGVRVTPVPPGTQPAPQIQGPVMQPTPPQAPATPATQAPAAPQEPYTPEQAGGGIVAGEVRTTPPLRHTVSPPTPTPAARLQAAVGDSPQVQAPASAADPVHAVRDAITDFVQATLALPQDQWQAQFTAFLQANPAVYPYLRQTGLRPAMRDGGADADTIERVVAMVEASGMNPGGLVIPYGE